MGHRPRSISFTFAALPCSARKARVVTTRVLTAWQLFELVAPAELLVSELITNAVKHAGGLVELPTNIDQSAADLGIPPHDFPPEFHTQVRNTPLVLLSLSLFDGLRVEVWDKSSAPPVRRVSGHEDVSGRGLELVEALSKEWGWDLCRTGGKIVWCAIGSVDDP